MSLHSRVFALALLVFVGTTGCSMKKIAIRSTGEIIKDGMEAFYDEEDLELARAAAPSNLKLIEGLVRGDPKNKDLLLVAASAFGGYAFGFLEMDMELFHNQDDDKYEDTKRRAKLLYQRSLEYSLRILRDDFPEFDKLMQEGSADDMKAYVSKAGQRHIGGLFWTAFAWGNIVNLSRDDMGQIAQLPKVKVVMEKVAEIDETYFNGGPHLFFAILNTGIPKGLGGNPEKGKEHFEKAFEINNGKLLLANVFFARFYAVAVQDKKLYEEQLDKVLNAPDDIMPGQNLYTAIAKARAKVLKERVEDFILE